MPVLEGTGLSKWVTECCTKMNLHELSPSATDLLEAMLQVDPAKRISASAALEVCVCHVPRCAMTCFLPPCVLLQRLPQYSHRRAGLRVIAASSVCLYVCSTSGSRTTQSPVTLRSCRATAPYTVFLPRRYTGRRSRVAAHARLERLKQTRRKSTVVCSRLCVGLRRIVYEEARIVWSRLAVLLDRNRLCMPWRRS